MSQSFPEELQTVEVLDCAAAAMAADAGDDVLPPAERMTPEQIRFAVDLFRGCTDQPVALFGYSLQAGINGVSENVGACMTDLAADGEIDHTVVYPLTDHRPHLPEYTLEELEPLTEALVACAPGSELTLYALERGGAEVIEESALDKTCLDAAVDKDLRRRHWEQALVNPSYQVGDDAIELLGDNVVPCISVGRQLSAMAAEMNVEIGDEQIGCLDDASEGLSFKELSRGSEVGALMGRCLTAEQLTELASAGS